MSNQRTRLLVATFAVALLSTMAFAPTAHADRRSSLGGNLLIKDTDEIFFFPQNALEHVRLVTFDLALGGDNPTSGNLPNDALGATSQFGNAGLIFGDDKSALGIFTHRSDTFGALVPGYYLGGDIDSVSGTADALQLNLWPTPQTFTRPSGGEDLLTPLQWIDLMGAFDVGGSPLGFRLSIGHHQDNSTTDNDGDIFINDNSVWGVNAVVGYSLRGANELDLSVELGYGSQSFTDDQDGDPVNVSSATGFNFAAMARGFSNMAKGVELGYTGLLYYRSYSSTVDYEDGISDGADASLLGLDVGAGPLYHVDDKFNIAAHAGLGIQYANQNPSVETDPEDDGQELSRFGLVIPSLKLSGEYRVFEWLWLRTGAQYFYQFNFVSDQPGQDAFRDTSETISGFRWVSGVGVVLGDLELNGTFKAPFMLSGPNFIGGGSDMFAHLNVQYRF